MYSDISKRIRESLSPNINSANTFASSVFPTPVGPRKRKVPIGRFISFNPDRERRIALVRTLIASPWPITLPANSSSIFIRRILSFSSIRERGIPVILETTSAISSSVTLGSLVSRCLSHSFLTLSSFSTNASSLSRNSTAFSNSWFSIQTFLSRTTKSISFWIFFISGDWVVSRKRTLEPASSITSIALSGRKRSVI